ncbi:hypothetical protein LINGRAHAP2_LOCUS31931 [Linum grandiflorum]
MWRVTTGRLGTGLGFRSGFQRWQSCIFRRCSMVCCLGNRLPL